MGQLTLFLEDFENEAFFVESVLVGTLFYFGLLFLAHKVVLMLRVPEYFDLSCLYLLEV